MRVRLQDATEPPGARESDRARSTASARPRPCARRERALTRQVTRARRGALSATWGTLCPADVTMVQREANALQVFL